MVASLLEAPQTRFSEEGVEVSVVMPCLNEARTVGVCVDKALACLETLGVRGEVVIADNGSSDGSQHIAREHGARVVNVERKGYGSALQGGITALASSGDTGATNGSFAAANAGFPASDPFVTAIGGTQGLPLGNLVTLSGYIYEDDDQLTLSWKH